MRIISITMLIVFFLTPVFAQTEFIAPSLTDAELIDYLQSNYTATTPKSYNSARDAMYGTIDNKSGQIIGVYTGFTITANTGQIKTGSMSRTDRIVKYYQLL